MQFTSRATVNSNSAVSRAIMLLPQPNGVSRKSSAKRRARANPGRDDNVSDGPSAEFLARNYACRIAFPWSTRSNDFPSFVRLCSGSERSVLPLLVVERSNVHVEMACNSPGCKLKCWGDTLRPFLLLSGPLCSFKSILSL